ncbi:uncharacterized protein BO87DRAFT_401279 [Aspergillus neoniger CBS 115656]|uniref:Uncharacterized protein n=1 Tax=Aspergillus neoniger (strain CBS 115656) TaxID=1448310 RepID=A0A318Y5G5_ASPNB|nr:hypothetical protein BO87DRAFT_401279 [Aspergillus neoniger CBS 115656]PYH29501.1 hypothetical protein BO87DRAFT_401279 [Aspergillus neoniger CBS 115656]
MPSRYSRILLAIALYVLLRINLVAFRVLSIPQYHNFTLMVNIHCGVETLNNGSSYVISLSIVVSKIRGNEGCPRASRISTTIFPDTVISHVTLVGLVRFVWMMTRETCSFGGDTTPAPHVRSNYGAMEAQNATGQIGQTIGLVILRKRLKGLDLEGREWTILFCSVDTTKKGDDPWNEWVGIPIRHRV